jgi:hypothetical protein
MCNERADHNPSGHLDFFDASRIDDHLHRTGVAHVDRPLERGFLMTDREYIALFSLVCILFMIGWALTERNEQ